MYFLREGLHCAGGLLSLGGSFLSQFYYYPFLGSVLFIALLVLIKYLTVVAFDVPDKWQVLAYLPPLLLLLSVIQLGYVWLTLKSPGYFFSNTLGIIFSLTALIGYRRLSAVSWRLVYMAGLMAAGYPLFGFYALLAVALLLGYELRLFFTDRCLQHFVPLIAGVVLALALPRLYYELVYSAMQGHHIYIAGLPRFAFSLKELPLWAPFLLLFATLFLLQGFKAQKQTVSLQAQNSTTSLLLLACAMAAVYLFSFRNSNFETEVKMAAAIARNNFSAVVFYADRIAETPTRNIVLNNNLALMALGQPESRKLSLQNVVEPESPRPSIPINVYMSGRTLFYLTGQVNECYRWSMEEMVEYGQRAVGLKYMVKCAIVNEEYALAHKYNKLLSQTFFHRSWARRYQKLIDQPELSEKNTEIQAIRRLSAQEVSALF